MTNRTEAKENKENEKGRFRGLSRVKHVTKRAAKHFIRILTKAKSALNLPLENYTSDISSTATQSTDVSMISECGKKRTGRSTVGRILTPYKLKMPNQLSRFKENKQLPRDIFGKKTENKETNKENVAIKERLKFKNIPNVLFFTLNI